MKASVVSIRRKVHTPYVPSDEGASRPRGECTPLYIFSNKSINDTNSKRPYRIYVY